MPGYTPGTRPAPWSGFSALNLALNFPDFPGLLSHNMNPFYIHLCARDFMSVRTDRFHLSKSMSLIECIELRQENKSTVNEVLLQSLVTAFVKFLEILQIRQQLSLVYTMTKFGPRL